MEAFVLTNTNHEHKHDHDCNKNEVENNCTLCIKIEEIENLLRPLRATFSGTFPALLCLTAITAFLCFAFRFIKISTPVKLKTRMNN
jgi:hypothetical protein